MKIRLNGTRVELEQARTLLGKVYNLVSVGEPYRQRGSTLLYQNVEVLAKQPASVKPRRAAGPRQVPGQADLFAEVGGIGGVS